MSLRLIHAIKRKRVPIARDPIGSDPIAMLLKDHTGGAEEIVQGEDYDAEGQPLRHRYLMVNKKYGTRREESDYFRVHLEYAGDILRRMCEEGVKVTKSIIGDKIKRARSLLDNWDAYTSFYNDHMKDYHQQDYSNSNCDPGMKRNLEDASASLKEWNDKNGDGKGFMKHLSDAYMDLARKEYVSRLPPHIQDALNLMVAFVSLNKPEAQRLCSKLETYLSTLDD